MGGRKMENTLSIVSKLHSWRSMPYISQCQQVKEQGRGKQRSVRVLQAASRMGYRTAILPAAMGMRRLRSASNHASETKKSQPNSSTSLMFLLTIHEEMNCYRIAHNQAEGSRRIWASSWEKKEKEKSAGNSQVPYCSTCSGQPDLSLKRKYSM